MSLRRVSDDDEEDGVSLHQRSYYDNEASSSTTRKINHQPQQQVADVAAIVEHAKSLHALSTDHDKITVVIQQEDTTTHNNNSTNFLKVAQRRRNDKVWLSSFGKIVGLFLIALIITVLISIKIYYSEDEIWRDDVGWGEDTFEATHFGNEGGDSDGGGSSSSSPLFGNQLITTTTNDEELVLTNPIDEEKSFDKAVASSSSTQRRWSSNKQQQRKYVFVFNFTDDDDGEQTQVPTDNNPTKTSTKTPTANPTASPTLTPTPRPTPPPTNRPTQRPPTPSPTGRPTNRPTPSTPPPFATDVTFVPGLLNVQAVGLVLSQGLNARLIAVSGQRVQYDKLTGLGSQSRQRFHTQPDAGAVFEDRRGSNEGGWIYVSNSEEEGYKGGVGAITFDRRGRIIQYQMLLEGSDRNCGGGRTPWNTWVSCEESNSRSGLLYQVDPSGQRDPQILTLGRDGGIWESFAYDVRNRNHPYFYVTEDHEKGALQRFKPSNVNWRNDNTAWNMLHSGGLIEYLFLHPTPGTNQRRGVFSWGRNKGAARENAKLYYPFSEGIDIHDGVIYFVCKKIKMIYELNVDTMEYTRRSTASGLFDGGPDQLKRILSTGGENFLFFTEDGGRRAGVHGRDENGLFFTVLESVERWKVETTGLAFSPDNKHMYIAYQDIGRLFDVTRKDGHPFSARRLDVKYHAA